MSDLSSRLAGLSAEKRDKLEQALLARRWSQRRSIVPRDRSLPSPLSSSQQRLWFFDQLAPGAPTYNAIVAMWVTGELDEELLQEAVRDSVRRHEVLRTVITLDGEEPSQVVLDDWTFGIRRLTCDADTPEARDAQAIALARDAAREPYDLAHDLTLRVLVVHVEPGRKLLAFLEHHISFDGWSDEILFDEVSTYYATALTSGRPPDRPSLPIQFADFAAWQRGRIDSGDLAGQLTYWKGALAGAPATLALPLDHARSARQTFDGRHLELSLHQASGLRAVSRDLGATDFMVLVAAWAATLYRWTGQPDIVLGTPMANRNRVEVEHLIGFFSNTIPLRVRVDGSSSFRDLVRQVTQVSLEAFDNQDLPFEKIVEGVGPPRDPQVNPLFQVNVRVHSGGLPTLELPGAQVQPVHIDMGFSRFDLAVEFHVEGDAISGYVEYNRALFDESTVRMVLRRLDALLEGALEDPGSPVWDLPQPSSDKSRRRGRS